jgi:hypothetical protein
MAISPLGHLAHVFPSGAVVSADDRAALTASRAATA